MKFWKERRQPRLYRIDNFDYPDDRKTSVLMWALFPGACLLVVIMITFIAWVANHKAEIKTFLTGLFGGL